MPSHPEGSYPRSERRMISSSADGKGNSSSAAQMDPLWLAMSKFRRGQLDQCIEICNEILEKSSGDQAAWLLKCRAVTKQNHLDDIELDEEGVAEILMDENAIAAVPRPGTSLNALRPGTNSKGNSSYDPSVRPVSQSGRPLTGFTRPNSGRVGTASGSSRGRTGTASDELRAALQSSRRAGTARPMTNLGREIRLGTASLSSSATGPMIDIEKFNVKKYASKTGIAMAVTDYLLYVEHNTRKALALCAEATKANDYKSWWWKARLGKCYYKLGLLRDAEQQFKSSLAIQPVINTYLELVNVYLRLDLPNSALDLLTQASEKFTCEPRIPLGTARIYDSLHDHDNAISYYKKVLVSDAANIEAIACLGAHFFYSDQPEMAIRYFRRLLQMGISTTEVWNNIGLCCFYSGQYDMALNCFERSLALASDEEMGDVWYNIGHIGVALGDLGLAYQAFKVAVSVNPNHGEALNNIAVLELRRQKYDVARSCLQSSSEVGPHLFEPLFNSALMAYRMGDFQEAHKLASSALQLYPGHLESKDLLDILQKTFLHN